MFMLSRKSSVSRWLRLLGTNKDDSSVRKPPREKKLKVYPNDPCPCGSGKKYKQCCGRKTANV